MIFSLIYTLAGFAAIALLITAALAPIETLSWWAGWTDKEIDEVNSETSSPPTVDANVQKQFIVYLSGVASISGRYLLPREKVFIKELRQRLPDAIIIDGVFPYSPAGLPLLAGPRFFDRLWRWIQKLKLEGRRTLLSALINTRNIFQVLISADHRYGPIFNQGAAEVIEDELIKKGYKRGSGAPVTIIGYSGGGQIALGASSFLRTKLKAPIEIISIGGVIASDPGLHFIRRLHYLFGDGDIVQRIGAVMFPERWKAMAHSEWNTAKHDGRIVFHEMKNMIHAGPRGYFGLPKVNGISNNDRTLEAVISILSPSIDR